MDMLTESWVPMRFTVRHRGNYFLDVAMAETLASLMAQGKVRGEAPLRVMLTDGKGKPWGASRPIFMVQGTVSSFAPGMTLKAASQRWPARLRELGIKPKRTGALYRCVVEVPCLAV